MFEEFQGDGQIIQNEAYIYFFLEANLKVLLKKKIDMMKLVEAL